MATGMQHDDVLVARSARAKPMLRISRLEQLPAAVVSGVTAWIAILVNIVLLFCCWPSSIVPSSLSAVGCRGGGQDGWWREAARQEEQTPT